MIICSNCGATNNEANTNICRKCGALLPVSTRPPRVKIKTPQKEVKKSKKKDKQTEKKLDLQDIPLSEKKEIEEKIFEEKGDSIEEIDVENEFNTYLEEEQESERDYLKEIPPTPFKGSIITEKNVYGPPRQKKATKSEETHIKPQSTIVRQKQLEEDMTKVLKFLSNKITVKQLPVSDSKKESVKKDQEKLPPVSMNSILKDLLKLDLNIEASAIIKSDGTILASAISSRISDTLFGTIGQNLSMIGTDIINGLSAGKLQNISLRGTKGVLDLAPINKTRDMLLIIFSHPKVKSGIIHLAAKIVEKQVKQYLGISKE